MDYASSFLTFVCDGLKWVQKHIGYATNMKSEMRKLEEEMDKLNDVCADVDRKVVRAHIRCQHVKKQVDGWQSRVQDFKAKVVVDFQLPLNCSFAVHCPNCWSRYKLGKRVVLEHKGVVANLIVEGREYSNGTVVDPDLPSPIETNIRSIQEEAKRLGDLEVDINSKVEATKRERLLLPKRQVEGWIKQVFKHKQDVSAIQKDFEGMENSNNDINLHWMQLSERAENLLKEIKELISEGRTFEDVADPSRPVILVKQAVVPTIGQDEVYAGVLSLIKNEQVRRIGIHGMGGSGKTTLLKRINNSFEGSDFELIIWVSVSKDFTIDEIQQSIMKRCRMDYKNDKPHEMESKIHDFLKGKRYVLLLDDVWKALDLISVGVPSGDNKVKSKILITSRSIDVCDRMEATKVQVGCLNLEKAWELFTAKVGEAILASDRETAKQICQLCGGLPLALEVIGTAMSGKHNFYEWSDAKNTLEKHAPGFDDSEEKLFSRLKLSYDSLKEDTAIRECFCHCALFCADYEIDSFDLVSCWIGEGLFDDECENIDAARNKGYTIIRELIKVGLLKDAEEDEILGTLNRLPDHWHVSMHDVLRDMALWIRKDEFKINKGRSGFGEISKKEARLGLTTFGKYDSMERRQQELLEIAKSAPNLSTLITTGEGTTLFTDDMLEVMNKLRVLHVYGWYKCQMPRSIDKLKDLRCLILLGNATLASLEVLEELGSLRLLIMNVPAYKPNFSFEGVISRLSKLQALILRGYVSITGVEDLGVRVSELESLPCLKDLQLSISTASFLKELAHSSKLARCVSDLAINKMDISCFRIVQEVGSMDRLKLVHIIQSEMTEFVIEEEGWLLPRLEVLAVKSCYELKEIFKMSRGSGIVFSALRIILIRGCRMLKIICSDAFCFPSLQILDVRHCEQLKRLPRGVIQARKKSLKEIRGSQRWWDELTWDSEEDRKALLPLFKAKYVEADPSRPAILVEQATVPTIGQDEVYDRVLSLISNGQVARIGIHGMGGVGKTTLLKRINNSFEGSDFELIIWVTVSEDFTIGEIQRSIMKRCGMDGKNDKPHVMESKIRDFLRGKRYALLLDDVWEPLDLNSLGVPSGDNEVKSMILITSRSEGVCDRMQAKKVPINCLDPNEAWALFRAKVGEAILAFDPKIEELAEQICQLCGGLPLVLEGVGAAMRTKYTVSEWSDAKNTLEKFAPGFEDIEEKLFSHLKRSYDSLKNDTIRECFCYCALFREDWVINTFDLVSCWIGEGLFDDECDNIDAARSKGYTIIRELIKDGLLKEAEDGEDDISATLNRMIDNWNVVMHDIIRAMALWIRKDEFKISKGRSGFGKISGKEARLGLTTFGKYDSMDRRRKQELLQFGKSAPNLSTLITTGQGVTLLTDDMLEAMNKLRVLHVYGGYGCELPPSIRRLNDLRCLNLSDNATLASLEVLAELGSLRLLIMNVPDELSFQGVISRLSKLQALTLRENFSIRSGVERAGISVSELESLPCLEDLQLSICTASFFKGLAHSPKLARCVSHLQIIKMDISCFRLIQEVGSMDRLKFLCFDINGEMTEFIIEEEGCKPNTLCNLTVLLLFDLKELINFRVSMEPKNSLQYLKFIHIDSCDRLQFAYLGWPLPQLEFLMVVKCSELEEIFKIWKGSGIVFSALRIIRVHVCPNLKIICSDAFCFPSLQILEVKRCKQLKRLPRGVIQASKGSLQEIRGSQRWWDELTWDSEKDKISLLPLFKPKDDY